MEKIYISGRITGLDLDECAKTFQEVENILTNQMGYEVVNPMKLSHDHDKKWESYMKECIKALMDCDFIFVIEKGIEHSEGAKIEIELAKKLNIKRIR
jgi:hypothetical protein